MKNVKITINGIETTVPENYTVLRAAEDMGYNIPRLCFLKDINETSACRLCVVNVKNMRGLKNSCTLAVQDGMEVETDSKEIRDSIVQNLQLLASNHVFECWACDRENSCELLNLMRRYDVDNVYGENLRDFFKKDRQINDTSDSIVLDSGKCILCGRCVSACEQFTELNILDFNERGNETYVGPALFHSMADSGCIECGKCIEVCPVAAIKPKSEVDEVLEALEDERKKVIVLPSPSVAVTVGEDFGANIGTDVSAKLHTAYQLLGFDQVMPYGLGKDLAIVEGSNELIARINDAKDLPLLASNAPGWMQYIEQYEKDYLANVSSAKPAEQISGALAKHYFADALGYNKADTVVVSIVPRIDRKHDAKRQGNHYRGLADVDHVITTSEFARLLKRQGIQLLNLEEREQAHGELAQRLINQSILHPTIGIAEATFKTASQLLQEEAQELDFKPLKGQDKIEEANYELNGKKVKIARISNVQSIKEFFRVLKTSNKSYDYVEMASKQDSNVVGGGSPVQPAKMQDGFNIIGLRNEALATLAEGKTVRRDCYSKEASSIYNDFLKEAGSELAQELLHIEYTPRSYYKD